MKRYFLYVYFVVMLLLTALCGLIYLVSQQSLRQSANDPQIQMAEDIAGRLSHGESVEAVIPHESTDIALSLSPVIIVFDNTGHVLVSQALLDGNIPSPPPGVFQYAATNGQNRFTWQPRPGVRMAAVVAPVKGSQPGFVLVARSIREIERREDSLFRMVGIAWIVLLTFFTVTFYALITLHARHRVS